MRQNKNQIHKHIAIVFFFLFVSSACDKKYENISSDVKFKNVVGSVYKTNEDLLIRGVVDDPHEPAHLEEKYYLMPSPGFDNRFVKTKEILKKGAELEILEVRRCINCLTNEYEYFAQVKGSTEFPYKMVLYNINEHYLHVKSSEAPILNNKYYTKVN